MSERTVIQTEGYPQVCPSCGDGRYMEHVVKRQAPPACAGIWHWEAGMPLEPAESSGDDAR
jgi:uncharacterized protein (DUF983 family)